MGFDQDLRDESLLAFTSMFFLIPLALRQVHEFGAGIGVPVFQITDVDQNNLLAWIHYFGAELAKAVPFVDWAEIYDVEGDGPIEMRPGAAQHVVFAARVLVDVVFLAALLQALSTIARNAKQIEMFRKGVLDRLDPFIESREFRRIVRRHEQKWERASGFDEFCKLAPYNLTRLIELKESGDVAPVIRAAAKLLYERDYQEADAVSELYRALREYSDPPPGKSPDIQAIEDVVSALETKALRQIEDLDDARRRLARYSSAKHLRVRLINLLLTAPVEEGDNDGDYLIKKSGLLTALVGTTKDATAPVRRVAFQGLRDGYLRGENDAIEALHAAAISDQSPSLRREIASFIEQNPRTPVVKDETQSSMP